MPDLDVSDLRGGMNVSDPPTALNPNQCVLAENIEWWMSTVGERRTGYGTVNLLSSNLDLEAGICHISQWFPGNDPLSAEVWAASTTINTAIRFARRQTGGAWAVLTPNDPIGPGAPMTYWISTLPLNAKLFIAYQNSTDLDRLHVWDGTTWRRTGLAQPPAAPTGGDAGGAGTFNGTRYYRVRYIEMAGSVVKRRSEPSPHLTVIPSGGAAAYSVLKPAAINEGETHWELEASTDNANFYRIAVSTIATVNYGDFNPYATGYSAFPLSEPIGYYLLQPCARFLAIEGDRLIFAGHWSDLGLQSQVGWSPVKNDPGVSNDERFPLNSLFNNRVSLDNFHNGPITGITNGVNGSFYVFKWSAIYRATRTGNLQRAYEFTRLSGKRGAIQNSIVEAFDEAGNPCVYFLDPKIGPCRLGEGGIQPIYGQRRNWERVNLVASLICCGVYYPYKQQVWWNLAVDGQMWPCLGLRLHVAYGQPTAGGIQGSWSIVTGDLARVSVMAMVTESILASGGPAGSDRPYLGTTNWTTLTALLGRGDIGVTDAGVNYVARLRTRPVMAGSLMHQWGVLVGALAAFPQTLDTLTVRLIRDLGLESVAVTTDLQPAADELEVVKVFDNLNIANSTYIQIEFADN